jgi:class 3 adenylate cyclase/tetratricopeptide (TPR) repeat protein
VPAVAIDWIRDEPERRWRVLDGSLCFADISGFTALTERLEARGPIGAEELVDTLDGVFGRMLEIVADRGGQLLKFGGDALLLLFDGDGHARRAAGAAVEMRRALRRTSDAVTSGRRLRLSMSVGIGSGDIHLFLVGAPSRELVVLGPVASATLAAEHTASAGQILVTTETATRLPVRAVERQVNGYQILDWRRAPAEPFPAPILGEHVDVTSLLPSDLAAVVADAPEPRHCVATVAFVRLSGIEQLLGRGLDGAADVLDRTLREIQAACRAEGVVILAVDVDQDGAKVMCAAGAPANSEDDEGRMLRAMRRIATSGLPLSVQIGINRGHVFAAELGTPSRAAYSAMGDTTNTAARIMSVAPPGSIYAHPGVLDHARTLYESRPVGPFTFKGKSEPAVVYDVGAELGMRAHAGRHALALVGRQDELAVLTAAIDDGAAGRGGVITLAGPTGVGKSRLVRDALAARPDVPVFAVRAEPYGAVSPYRPFRDPVRALLGIERAESDVMAAELLRAGRRIDDSLVLLAPLLGQVAHVEVPSTPEADAIGISHRPDRTADLVVSLLENSQPGPLVVVVEDAQWVDKSSAHLLSRIEMETSSRPWLLVVVRRDGREGFVASGGAHVTVGPLDDASLRALVIAATEAAPLRNHEIESIVAKAAGSPLVVEEWTAAARSLGSVEAVPDSLHAAIAAQIDSLSPVTRRALTYASVLGRSFRRRVLDAVLAEELFVLDEAVELELEGFLEGDGEARLRFRNGLVSDVAYESLAYRTRARLHRTTAETVERISEDVITDADILAYHFWRAGDHARTWRYSLSAADRARRAYANADAAMQLERALDAARWLDEVTDDERRQRWLQLGELRERAGLLDGALDAYRRAARYVAGDRVAQADLFLRRASTHERAGAYPVALAETTRARTILDGADGRATAAARAGALAFAALIRQRQEHADEALRLAELAATEGERAHALSAQARACNVISWAATMLGRPDAERWARRALELYEEVGDLVGQADMANNLGIQAFFEGRWGDTLDLYQRSRDACERVGNVIDAASTDANIGEVLVNQGRLDEAESVLREASRVFRASGHRWGETFAAMHRGRILTARGDLIGAEEALAGVRDQFLALGRSASAYEASLYLAECLAQAGRPGEALDVLARASRMTTDDVSIFDAARARITAMSLRAAGRVDEATRTLEQGMATARARGLEYELSLMLAAVPDWPATVDTGSDEPPAAESARLFARLGVVASD